MPKSLKKRVRGVVPIQSNPIQSSANISSTPISSQCPSAYPSEDESEGPSASKKTTFPFLSLPSELRHKIYCLTFQSCPQVLDLDPSTFNILTRTNIRALFLVSRQIHEEVSHAFFSIHTFRIFPTHPGRYFKTKKPLLARLPSHYRASIVTLELRLGPGWNNPPRGWIVNPALGLRDCQNVRVLKVFVECDPSDGIFKGFRHSDGFYERFSQDLLCEILLEVPSIKVVEFDAWSSVKRGGDMIRSLLQAVGQFENKMIAWGPERGWDADEDGKDWLDVTLLKMDPEVHARFSNHSLLKKRNSLGSDMSDTDLLVRGVGDLTVH
ncbi:hypothetical protein B7463_g3635, partial [Scytalidium lignicola]